MKYVVRYPPGGSGFFISALIHCVLHNSKFIPNSNGFAHHYNHALFSTHDFISLNRNLENFEKLFIYTDTEKQFNRDDALSWFQNNLRTANSTIINTHCLDVDLFIESLKSPTKLINICITEEDHNQICFNFLSKRIMSDSIHWFNTWGEFSCNKIKNNFPELKDSDIFKKFRSAIFNNDIKFLHWYIRLYRYVYFKKYQSYMPSVNCYTIDWSSISTKTIDANSFLDFLQIDQTSLRRTILLDAVSDYNSSQTTCPYDTKLSDYYSDLITIN